MRRGLVSAAVISLGLAAAACGGATTPRTANGPPVVMILPAADGGEVDFLRLRGRLVVVHVFSTWSLSAQADIEQLDAIFAGNAIAVIGVALDPNGSTVVPPWQRGSGARYPVALADDVVRAGRSALGPTDQVPTTLILDRSGGIVRRHVGPLPAGALATWLHDLR